VKEVRLELVFSRYETYEEKIKRSVPPQGAIGIRRNGQGIREDPLGETE
jgi:hypothetical protein